MSQQQSIPPSRTLSHLNEGDIPALNRLLSEIEPAYMSETLKELFRGWIASAYVQEKDINERADLYFTFERLLVFTETLHHNEQKNASVLS